MPGRLLVFMFWVLWASVTAASQAESTASMEYVGSISPEANQKIMEEFQQLRALGKQVSILEISSPGGSVRLALELAKWIHENDLAVRITDQCFSSCANYIAPAASTLYLSPNSLIAWHGGAAQPTSEDEVEKIVDDLLDTMEEGLRNQTSRESVKANLLSSRQQLLEDENRFYTSIGVKPELATIGQSCSFYEAERKSGRFIGWYLSIDDMKRFGIRNITVTGNGEWTPENNRRADHFFKIHLENCL